MTALITHQMQGSYVSLPSRPLPWIKGIKLKRYVTTCHVTARVDRSFLLKRNACLSVGPSCLRRPKPKALRISAFKGSAQNNEPGDSARNSKSSKNSVKLKESEDSLTECPNANDISLSFTSEANETVAPSPAIHRLFKKWLTNLRTQSSDEVIDGNGIIEEEPSSTEISETKVGTEKKESNVVVKEVWHHFLALDVKVKIPLLIFIPAYLAVNVLYGAEVSKELTPLWVLGPVIVALYIKMIQFLCWLYVFTFMQTFKIIKNLPAYSVVAYNYLVQGKLKKLLHARLVQPFVDIRNMNYKEYFMIKLKELQVWVVEMYLDFVESIWPYYCRTIRFLKRANLI